jgi:hypothetical protein
LAGNTVRLEVPPRTALDEGDPAAFDMLDLTVRRLRDDLKQ